MRHSMLNPLRNSSEDALPMLVVALSMVLVMAAPLSQAELSKAEVAQAGEAASSMNNWRENWDFQGRYWGALGAYYETESGSYSARQRERYLGVSIAGDYLEKSGFDVAYQNTVISYPHSDINQHEGYFGGYYNLFSDFLGGRVGNKISWIHVENDDDSGITDRLEAPVLKLSYTPWDNDWYFDVSASRSQYKNDFTVDQLGSTLGFGFNDRFDWVQARSYWVSPELNLTRVEMGAAFNRSVDLSWSHWMVPQRGLHLDNFYLSGMVGERQLAIDADAHWVQNLSDIMTSHYGAGLNFALDEKTGQDWKMGLSASYARYRQSSGTDNLGKVSDNYSDAVIAFQVSKHW